MVSWHGIDKSTVDMLPGAMCISDWLIVDKGEKVCTGDKGGKMCYLRQRRETRASDKRGKYLNGYKSGKMYNRKLNEDSPNTNLVL